MLALRLHESVGLSQCHSSGQEILRTQGLERGDRQNDDRDLQASGDGALPYMCMRGYSVSSP